MQIGRVKKTCLSLSLFYSIVYAFYSSFLTPHTMFARVCVCVFEYLKMPGFGGNVFLAALKCLTYFISSKTFCKYLFC